MFLVAVLVAVAVAIPVVAFISAKLDPRPAHSECPACGHTTPNFVSFEEKLAETSAARSCPPDA